jgi:hypothetical protein
MTHTHTHTQTQTDTDPHTHTNSLLGHQVEAHAVEQLVLLQHHAGQRGHELHVEGELDASRRVPQEVPPVLR